MLPLGNKFSIKLPCVASLSLKLYRRRFAGAAVVSAGLRVRWQLVARKQLRSL
jgi:hypothetical protein